MQFHWFWKWQIGALLISVAISPGSSFAFAADQASEDAALVIAGWKDWAARLLSGRYRAVGTVELHEEVDVSGDVKLSCAFDYPSGRYRFDRQQPFPKSIVRDENGNEDASGKTVIKRIRYSRTNEKSMFWSKGDLEDEEDVISIAPPDRAPRRETQPLDVRILGVVTFSSFENSKPELGGKMLDRAEEFLTRNKVLSIIRHPDGLTEVVWQFHYSDRGRMIAWFDESKGFLPVRTEFWHRKGDSAEFKNFLGRQEIHWTEKNGIQVPESCVAEEWYGPEKFCRFSLRFEWESVNAPIPESIFDVKADIPDDLTRVYDSRLGKQILIQAPGLSRLPEKSAPQSQSSWGKKLFLVTFTSSAVVVLWLFIRVRLRRP